MSGLWLSLSLLYAATFLQSSASADDCIDIASLKIVSLKCNTTVTVEAGQTVTLNCSICSTPKDFNGTDYQWYEEGTGEITCNSSSMKYNCEWDNQTYVSLIISSVVKDRNYTVEINGIRGKDKSSIKVQVIKTNKTIGLEPTTKVQQATYEKAFTLFIIIPLIASGILYFLFGTDRGRKIMKAIRKEKTQGDHSDMNAAPGSEDSLTA